MESLKSQSINLLIPIAMLYILDNFGKQIESNSYISWFNYTAIIWVLYLVLTVSSIYTSLKNKNNNEHQLNVIEIIFNIPTQIIKFIFDFCSSILNGIFNILKSFDFIAFAILIFIVGGVIGLMLFGWRQLIG